MRNLGKSNVWASIGEYTPEKALIFCAGVAAGALIHSTTRAARTRRRKKTFMKINIVASR